MCEGRFGGIRLERGCPSRNLTNSRTPPFTTIPLEFVLLTFPSMTTNTKPGWHTRGYLPHFDAAGALQHIVFCPRAGIFLTGALGSILQDTLLHFDRERYDLQAWCIMPDHCHVVVVLHQHTLVRDAVKGWKRWSTACWNRLNQRTGSVFGLDYFDRFARTLDQANSMIAYVKNNPVAEGLVEKPEDWPLSSACWQTRGWQPRTELLPLFLPPGSR